jgi:transposase
MQIMSLHFPVEQRERAVRMVLDHLSEYRLVYAACQAIGPKVGVGAESLRRWVLQAQVDAAQRPGAMSAP